MPLEGLDEGGYFDLTPLDVASDLRRETVLSLEGIGIEVASSHHEGAPSQHEIDLLYADALTKANDDLQTGGEGNRAEAQCLGYLYAETGLRREWKRLAYTHVAFRRRAECLLRSQ